MIPNADIIGGACEEVVDILENIPSDNERRAATDVGACDINITDARLEFSYLNTSSSLNNSKQFCRTTKRTQITTTRFLHHFPFSKTMATK